MHLQAFYGYVSFRVLANGVEYEVDCIADDRTTQRRHPAGIRQPVRGLPCNACVTPGRNDGMMAGGCRVLVSPPSTAMLVPVIQRASSDASGTKRPNRKCRKPSAGRSRAARSIDQRRTRIVLDLARQCPCGPPQYGATTRRARVQDSSATDLHGCSMSVDNAVPRVDFRSLWRLPAGISTPASQGFAHRPHGASFGWGCG